MSRASLTSKFTGTFHAAGAATGRTSGAGKRFVSFPGSISCSHHSATLRWTSAAGGVTQGAFLVNGHQKASDGNPRSGHRIVLRHLSRTADTTITAKLTLDGWRTCVRDSGVHAMQGLTRTTCVPTPQPSGRSACTRPPASAVPSR